MSFDKEDFLRFLERSKKQKLQDSKSVEYGPGEMGDDESSKGLIGSGREAIESVAKGMADVASTPSKVIDKQTKPYVEALEKNLGKGSWEKIEGFGTMLGSVGEGAGKLIKFPGKYKGGAEGLEKTAATPSNVESFKGFAGKLFERAKKTLSDEDYKRAVSFEEKVPNEVPEEYIGSQAFEGLKKDAAFEAAKDKLDPEALQIIEIASKNKKTKPETIEKLKRMAMEGKDPSDIKMEAYRRVYPRSYYDKPEFQQLRDTERKILEDREAGLIKAEQREKVIPFPAERSKNAPKQKGPISPFDVQEMGENADFVRFRVNKPGESAFSVPKEYLRNRYNSYGEPSNLAALEYAEREAYGPNTVNLRDYKKAKLEAESAPIKGKFKDTLKTDFEEMIKESSEPKTPPKPKMGTILEFPKERMGPVQDRSNIPFDATFREGGKENIINFPNKQEDYQRLMKVDERARNAAKSEGVQEEIKPALDKFMARFPGKDGDRILREISKVPETSPYVYLAGDVNNVAYAPQKGSKDLREFGGFRQVPRGTSPDKLPINAQGKRILGEGVEFGTNEPLSWMDAKYGVTRDLLEQSFDVPMVVKTRSDLLAHDDYITKLNPSKHEVEMHALTPNEHIGRIVEPGAPSFKRRIEAVQKLREAGVPVKLKMDILQAPSGTRLPESLQNAKAEWAEYLNTFPEMQSIVEPNYIKLDESAVDRLYKELKE